jgi:hypothetical protein
MNTKLEYIKVLQEKKKDVLGGPFDLLIHSILNTIDIRVLIDMNLSLANSAMKASIESNIFKRFETIENPTNIYDNLYVLLDHSAYHKRQRIRKMLFELLPSLGEIYKEDFFNTFFYSKYSNDKKAALSICSDIWNESFDSLILNKYFETREEIYLRTFLNNGRIEHCLPLLEQIWESNPSNYLKIILIRSLSQKYLNEFAFLRESEPDKYLLSISLSNDIIADDILIDCLNHIDEEIKPFGILSLSKINKWELIKDEIIKYVC